MFTTGHLVVQEYNQPFSAVPPDVKLEQTIQRSQKSSRGITGQTRQQIHVTERALTYHEVVAISSSFRELIDTNSAGYRSQIDWEFIFQFVSVCYCALWVHDQQRQFI